MTSTTRDAIRALKAPERRWSLLAAAILSFGVIAMLAWCCVLVYALWFVAMS